MKYTEGGIQSAIDHIKTALDVDPWAKEICEDVLSHEIPKTPVPLDFYPHGQYKCPSCGNGVTYINRPVGCFGGTPELRRAPRCEGCGQRIDWREERA